jgi:hypothetical protein
MHPRAADPRPQPVKKTSTTSRQLVSAALTGGLTSAWLFMTRLEERPDAR